MEITGIKGGGAFPTTGCRDVSVILVVRTVVLVGMPPSVSSIFISPVVPALHLHKLSIL